MAGNRVLCLNFPMRLSPIRIDSLIRYLCKRQQDTLVPMDSHYTFPMQTHSIRVDILEPTTWQSISCYSVRWNGPIRLRLSDDKATSIVIATRSRSNKGEFVLQTLDLENLRESNTPDFYRIERCNYLWFLDEQYQLVVPDIRNVGVVKDDDIVFD